MMPYSLVLEDHTASVFRAEVSEVWKVAGSREVSKGKVVPPGTCWIGGWEGPGGNLCQELNPSCPVRSLLLCQPSSYRQAEGEEMDHGGQEWLVASHTYQ